MRWRSPFLIGALIGFVLIVLMAIPTIVLGYTHRIPVGVPIVLHRCAQRCRQSIEAGQGERYEVPLGTNRA